MSEPRRITERYRLEKRVSSRDSGSVFRAVDTQSGETVTVKLINAGDTEEQRELFESHAAALREVRHPALPRILDFGYTTAGSAFLVTEYLEGFNLAELEDAPPARVLSLLLQLTEGLEAITGHGLALRNLSLDNLRVVPEPDGERLKILGLGNAAFLAAAPGGPDGYASDRLAFADVALRALGLSLQESRGTVSVPLPLQVAGSLEEPERLREVLEGILRGDPEGRFSTWGDIRRTLRAALFGDTGRRARATSTMPLPVSSAGGTAQIPLPAPVHAPRNKAWEEVRLGASAPAPLLARSGSLGDVEGGEGHDTTMALERLGPAPAAEPPPVPAPGSGTMILSAVSGGTVPGAQLPPASRDFVTRVLKPEEVEATSSSSSEPDRVTQVVPPPPPPPVPAGGGTVRIDRAALDGSGDPRRGTVRIPLKDLEEPAAPAAPTPPSPPPAAPLAGTLRFPSPVPPARPVDEIEETQPQARRTGPPPVPPPIPKPVPVSPAPAQALPPVDLPPLDLPPVPKAAAPPPVRTPPAVPPVVPPAVAAPPAVPPPVADVPEPAVMTETSAESTVATPAPAPQPAPPRRKSDGKGLRMALLIGVPAIVLLTAVVGGVAWMSRRSAEPEPPPPVQAQPVPKPAPRPAQPPPQPRPFNAQIVLAEGFLTAGDLTGAKTALESIPPEQMALFTSEEQERYQSALAALTPLQSQAWDESLTRGLSNGDLRLLRAAVAAPPAAATLTPEQKKGLTRARKILDLDLKLSKAQRAKNQSDILRQSGLLLAELPRNARAQQARKQAADTLIAQADAQAGEAQFDAALATLQHLQEGWADHPGIGERLERLRAERRADEQMEAVLARVTRAERADRPRDGLQALADTRPNERYAERFRQARERLEAQLVQLDRNPPQIAAPGVSEMAFEKGATVTIPLRITDDLEVASAEAWVRPEGGRFTRVNVRAAGGSSYEIEVSPDLHQNKSIDFYVKATDSSGHEGTLGSVQRPEKVKRKKWFSKIRGGKEGDGEE